MSLKNTIKTLINSNIRFKALKVKKTEHADVEDALLDAICIPFQVIEMDCTQQFIDDNFDWAPGLTQGLGINLMDGYAFCNGNNGTKDRRRRTSVCYDPANYTSGINYSDIDAKGGSANAVLVSHNHTITLSQLNGENDSNVPYAAFCNSGTNTQSQDVTATSTTAGEPGTDKNMQPFLITFFVQRL